MPSQGKPDATGRSSGKGSTREKKTWGPPKGEPWIWLTTELLVSPAWRLRSINAARLIDFLLIEHRNHAGLENGNLMATYDQLVDHGLKRRFICAAISEAEFLGLIRCDRGGRWADKNQPSTYRLTFYTSRDDSSATNEWKGKTAEAVREWKRDQTAHKKRRMEGRKKQISGLQKDTTVVHLCKLRTAKTKKTP